MMIGSSALADWYHPAWGRRVFVTIDSTQITGIEALTEIPLVVILDQSRFDLLFQYARNDASDLLVTGADGVTPWDFELVEYDPVSMTGELWVRAPVLSTEQASFYVYFANSDPELLVDRGQVFADEYLAVYHFDSAPGLGVVADSSPHANFAVVGAGSAFGPSKHVSGKVGSGWAFDGIRDWVYTQNVSSTDSSFTISVWHSNLGEIEDGSTAMQSAEGFWNLSFQRSGQVRRPDLECINGYMVWNPDGIDDAMHQYVWVMDGVDDVARFYLDGVEQNLYLSYTPSGTGAVYSGQSLGGPIGIAGPAYFNPFDLSDGTVDEYRIYEGVLGSDRIRVEYANQSMAEDFIAFASFEQYGATAADPAFALVDAGRISVWPNPFQSMARIEVESAATISDIGIFDLAGRRVRSLGLQSGLDRIRSLRWDGRDDRGEAVGGGVYFVRVQSDRGTSGAKILLVR